MKQDGQGTGDKVVVWRRAVIRPALSRSMAAAWAGLSAASKRLLLIGGLLMLAAVGALVFMLWELRQDALAEARRSLATLGTAIAEQTSRSMQASDLVLEDLRRQIAGQRIETVEAFKSQLADRDMYLFLKDRADFLPQVDAFTIIAADGRLVNYSRQWPPRLPTCRTATTSNTSAPMTARTPSSANPCRTAAAASGPPTSCAASAVPRASSWAWCSPRSTSTTSATSSRRCAAAKAPPRPC